jgi:diguanylate cyclase (GGDEF)-like protein
VTARGADESRDVERRALGEALAARAGDVLELVVRRCGGATPDPPPPVPSEFARMCLAATESVARALAAEQTERDIRAGREAWDVFSRMPGRGAARLDEVTQRCLWWRDAVEETLESCASALGTSPEVLASARALAQMTLDVTLIRLGESYEQERARSAHELDRRREDLAYAATHDELTGLANRSLLVDRCEHMLARSRRTGMGVAAIAVGLDDLAALTDTLGESGGKELICAVARRLDSLVRDVDALARLGEDEFGILAEDLADPDEAEVMAGRLAGALAEPFSLTGEREAAVMLRASVGFATARRTGAGELLRDAEIAMRRARSEGMARPLQFRPGMHDVVQSRAELEGELRGALQHGELFLLYQPTFDLRDLAPTGLEALLRWRRRGRGVVPPGDFVPLLEESGLILDVGAWVMREACERCAAWRREGHQVGLAVTISELQLESDEFVEHVREALAKSGLEPEALTLDLAETTVMRDAVEVAARLFELRDLGVRVAIDDFGTGYSSLAHLERFPVDALKIHRSFVSQLGASPEAKTLIRTLVQLGRALALDTLAKGIEQESELAILRAESCGAGQGFLFARPLEARAATEFLDRWRRTRPATQLPHAAA